MPKTARQIVHHSLAKNPVACRPKRRPGRRSAHRLFSAIRETIVGLAAKHKLPTHYPGREYVEVGGLISYGANFRGVNRRAADYVDKVLRGTKPADLPIEQPTAFELVVNLKTAKALGLTVPPSVLLRADQVIE